MIYSDASARRCSASMDRGKRCSFARSNWWKRREKLGRKNTARYRTYVSAGVWFHVWYVSLLNPFGLLQQKSPSSDIYCESRPISPLPWFTPSRGPAMQISFSPRASVLYGASLLSRSSLTRSTTLSAYRFFLLLLLLFLPRALSFLRRYHPFVRDLSRSHPFSFLSAFRSPFSAIVSHGRPPSSSSSFPPRAPSAPAVFHSATPPTPPPSRPIQSPPRHPSFTASVAAYRLSFCHCGLFDILSTAVRTEAVPGASGDIRDKWRRKKKIAYVGTDPCASI